jgi:hypothetical protein
LIGHFLPSSLGFALSWISVWLVGFGLTSGEEESNEQISWESVSTRPFWANLSNKETYKEWLLGSGLLEKDNTKQNPTKANI